MPSIGRRSSADAPAHIIHSLAVLSLARGLRHLQAARVNARRPKPAVFQGEPQACGSRGDPKPLPLQASSGRTGGKALGPEPKDPTDRVAKANEAARVQPSAATSTPCRFTLRDRRSVPSLCGPRTGYGYRPTGRRETRQVGTRGCRRYSALDHWRHGKRDRADERHIEVKPTRPDLVTNLVINTDRRTYHLELRSTEKAYMASVSWQYPQDQLIALRRHNAVAEAATPVDTGLDLARLNFRYAIEGDTPAWRPLRAFDDGAKVFIEFPRGIRQGEMPPLFVLGPEGGAELVNYRARQNYYVVDRLFRR